MIEFNDSITTVDTRTVELMEIMTLIKLVPFVERDVEERCAALEEAAQEEVKLKRGMQEGNAGYLFIGDDEIYAECERKKKREYEREERLRRAILERAGRVFPELAAGEPQDKGESFSSGSQGEDGSLSAREGENARGVSYVDGVVTRQPGESPMK